MYLCVITYQYEDREPVEIPNLPTSKKLAEWQAAESDRLFVDNAHVLGARVYSEADYRTHEQRRLAEALVIS